MDIKQFLPGIQTNVSLAEYTTFKIGGKTRYFFVANTKKDVIKALKAAKQLKLPFFILGGGSNVLISDQGFEGLIIKVQSPKSKVQSNIIFSEAGVKLSDIIGLAANAGLSGLEWGAGIYGTIGGAIRGNAGAFGKSISDIISQVEVLDISTSKIKNYKPKDCGFGYRDSIFKKNPHLIILFCELRLNKGDKREIEKKMAAFIEQKKKTQPLDFPSAGSIFKNSKFPRPPAGAASEAGKSPAFAKATAGKQNSKLFIKHPELEKFREQAAIPAGFLIEKCGLKGKKIGDAQISEKHANFIINLGKAKAKDVLQLIDLIKKSVKKEFGIVLEEEIVIL